MATLRFLNTDDGPVEVEVPVGTTVLQAAQRAHVGVAAPDELARGLRAFRAALDGIHGKFRRLVLPVQISKADHWTVTVMVKVTGAVG